MKQDETYKRIVRNDKRYDKIFDQMELLGIKDVSTPRQCKNGTVVWRLPIKYSTHPKFIEVASFSTGYVRNQNGGYTNYQLNKRCENEPEYFKDYEWQTKGVGDNCRQERVWTGKYRAFTTRGCVLIPKEIDRLEYLIGYCLKNYYIKKANEVINGKYISKWEHEYQLERANSECGNNKGAMNRIGVMKETQSELEDRIYELESQVDIANDKLVNSKDYTTDLKAQINMLQDKLKSVIRTARH